MKRWIEWAIHQYFNNHCDIMILIPARTDTKYFHELLEWHPEIIFIKGRLHYNDSKTGAPFPSLLIIKRYAPFPVFDYYAMDMDRIIYLIKEDKL